MPVVRITAFEVPPGADEAFLAAWAQAGDDRRGTLHRALRGDAVLRYVEIAPAAGGPDLYEVVRSDGDVDGAGGAVLIEAFEVAPDADGAFLAGWAAERESLSGGRGYLGARLHRALGDAEFRFVAVMRWSSPLMVSRASRRPGVGELPFVSHRALYERLRT